MRVSKIKMGNFRAVRRLKTILDSYLFKDRIELFLKMA